MKIDLAPAVATPTDPAVATIIFTQSRLDDTQTFSGPTNPDFALRLDNSCHNSVLRALSIYDGTKADVLEYNANQISQVHVNSDAANSNTNVASTIAFNAGNSYFAGFADYGIYVMGASAISQTQCDIANLACVYMMGNTNANLTGPGQITDTQMKCGSLVTSGRLHGVELGAGVVNITVSGTAASATQCNVPGPQLVVLDGAIDPTVSLCNNSNAMTVFCAGYPNQSGFAAGQSYTQPSLGYSTVALHGAMTGATPSTPFRSSIPTVGRSHRSVSMWPRGPGVAVRARHLRCGRRRSARPAAGRRLGARSHR